MCEFNILAMMREPGHARGDPNLSWEASRWLLIHLPHHSRQFSPGPEPGQLPTTPIKHVIVIYGENRSFDEMYATYQPKSGETVNNLLSQGIVNADGSPGPN